MKNHRTKIVVFVLTLIAAWGWFLRPSWRVQLTDHNLPAAQYDPAPSPATGAQLPEATFSRWAAKGALLGEPPASLAGTQVDGALRVDDRGNLLLDSDLRQVFDYFLATIGEESLARIRARIAFHLQQQLPPAAAEQAWHVLNQYLHYKDALASLPGHDGSYAGMRDSLERQRSLRDSLLGPELASAFFHDEDQYADFALQHTDQLRNPDLSPQQRRQHVEALLSTLPDNLREQVQATAVPLQVDRQVQAMREQGASEGEIWQAREQQVGADAAERLAQLDRQREEWRQRYESYRHQVAAIESSAMADADRAEAIARLREEHFSAAEQKRVSALDRIAADARTLP